MPDGWARNLARASTSISHAEMRRFHLPSRGTLRTQRRAARNHGWRLAGDGALRFALDPGAWFPASAARLEMDLDCWPVCPADAPGRLSGDEPEAVPGADLGIRAGILDWNCRLVRRSHGPLRRRGTVSEALELAPDP